MLQRQKLEQRFFRALNSVVEPAVRRGLGSPRFTPGTLIVLESTGFKSGQQRRTPLLALRLGRRLLVSTARGDRSFWPRNLARSPDVTFYLGGRARSATAAVISPETLAQDNAELPAGLRPLQQLLERLSNQGWAFAVLSPT